MFTPPLLSVEGLSLGIRRRNRPDVVIVDSVSFDVAEGQRYGIVGESGSGKSMTLRSIAQLLPKGIKPLGGSVSYRGVELGSMGAKARRALMGPEIAMIFQEPMTALNPVVRVGDQITEGPLRHLGLSRKAARDLAISMMQQTGIPDAERRSRAYPHELSGGMRQRVVIAMALSCKPKLVLCDEPTTALDVTIQNQVLGLLQDLCADFGAALVFVTHDLAVVNQTCSDVAVMYAGRVVEEGPVSDVFARPRHPYTKGLLESAPDFDHPGLPLKAIAGFPASVTARPPGCAFQPRCPYAVTRCQDVSPPLELIMLNHAVACFESSRLLEMTPR